MKKPTRKPEFDIHYGNGYKHRLVAHESSIGEVFWPLPGGGIVTNRFAATKWAAVVGGGRL